MAGHTHTVRIDRAKTLAQEPSTGHNSWHEAIPPILRAQGTWQTLHWRPTLRNVRSAILLRITRGYPGNRRRPWQSASCCFR